MTKIFEVRFEQYAQKATAGRFTVPKAVTDILEIDGSSELLVEVTSHKGTLSKVTRLRSGNEIYGDFDNHFDLGELLTVRVTRFG
jgi:hypothetical protein